MRIGQCKWGSESEWGSGGQCLMQRPVHPSCGRVKQNVDGCLFVWTGKQFFFYFYSYLSRSPQCSTA